MPLAYGQSSLRQRPIEIGSFGDLLQSLHHNLHGCFLIALNGAGVAVNDYRPLAIRAGNSGWRRHSIRNDGPGIVVSMVNLYVSCAGRGGRLIVNWRVVIAVAVGIDHRAHRPANEIPITIDATASIVIGGRAAPVQKVRPAVSNWHIAHAVDIEEPSVE